MFPNLKKSLELPIIKNRTTFKQILPVSLNISKFDKALLTVSTDLKEFISSYTKNKEIFELQERHDSMESNTNKNFFSDDYVVDIFMFISAVISLLATTLTLYLLCKHKKPRVLMQVWFYNKSKK